MLQLFLVGIGTGNPGHLTREAEHAIRGADLILLPHKEDNKAELAQVPATGTATQQAHARVRAVGAGYLRFAQAETGLFRTAFGGRFTVQQQPDPALGGATGLNPFEHLSAALDDLVAAGALPAARRLKPMSNSTARITAWCVMQG